MEVQAFQAVYGIAGRVTVPETGETKRVQIDAMELDPALAVRAVPKRDEKAYLYAKITVAAGTPLLPGQVSLFRDATYVGNGRFPLLAPGEEHELGFGVDDSVRVRYSIVEEKRGETGHHHNVQNRFAQLSHHGQEPPSAPYTADGAGSDSRFAELRHQGRADGQDGSLAARR